VIFFFPPAGEAIAIGIFQCVRVGFELQKIELNPKGGIDGRGPVRTNSIVFGPAEAATAAAGKSTTTRVSD